MVAFLFIIGAASVKKLLQLLDFESEKTYCHILRYWLKLKVPIFLLALANHEEMTSSHFKKGDFMKKQLTVALGLAVLATPAFASKARLAALGEDLYGSFYINDNRNIFYNAAQVNNHKDLVTMEWGNTVTASGGDTVDTPKAEGGFFKGHGNLVYGVQLGSESNSSSAYRIAAGAAKTEENNIDLFVGGDAGVKWGANVTYSKSEKDESATGTPKQEALRTRFGVIAGDLEAYANINLANKAEVGAAEFKGKLGYQVGAIYNMNDYRVFADYRTLTGEASGTLNGDIKSSQLQVGAGKATKLNDKATLFTKVQYQMVNAENETALATNVNLGDVWNATTVRCGLTTAVFCNEYDASFIPVVVGLEYDATSWLAVRGSIAQTIWGSQESKTDKSGFTESTTVNAGASLKFGELSVDGLIGSGASATTGNSTSTGQFNTDTLMSRVSMTYKF
jgi:hypothetical protein